MANKPQVIRNWRYPVRKVHLGSLFGVVDQWHKAPGHRGTDYNGFAAGEPLYAVADGTIVMNKALKDSPVLGNVIVLQVGGKFFGYCHMVEQSPLKVGTVVKSGDVVGHAGNTGTASAGVHLHLTLGTDINAIFYGKVYDAQAFLTQKIADEKVLKAQAGH